MKTLLSILLAFFPLFVSAQSEGKLYREASQPEVYVIHDGKKIWIPTPDALFGMGYSWNQVNIVPDGALNGFPRFNIPSASATPGSLIFPPDIPSFGSIDKSHHPVKLANSTRVLSRSHVPTAGMQEIQLSEIRGWLASDIAPLPSNGEANPEGKGYDFSFSLIPDYKWLKANNIDINKVIWVGNIAAADGGWVVTGTTSKNMVSIPTINIEINSWMWRSRSRPTLANPPADWVKFTSTIPPPPFPAWITLNIFWPFNPNFKAGQYVSVFGSFVTDSPHASNPCWANEIDRWAPSWLYRPEQENHYARWTEIHPADLIVVRSEQPPQTETTYGLVMYANVTQTNSMAVDLSPKAPRPSGSWRVAYEEILGPECLNPNPGSASCHYTKVTKYDDHINVSACTTGGGALSGTPGRIRALYRVWWEEIPSVNLSGQATRSSNVFSDKRGFFTVKAVNAQNQPLSGEVYYNNVRVGSTNQQFSMANASTNCTVTGTKTIYIDCPAKIFTFKVVINNQNYSLTVTLASYKKKI